MFHYYEKTLSLITDIIELIILKLGINYQKNFTIKRQIRTQIKYLKSLSFINFSFLY